MILDQTIGSARAEAHWNYAGRRFIGNLLTATLANPVSRFDALDELESVSADTADRYADAA
jgi:hypothetical protein